ncbi:hypothetical protein [Amphritea sp. HPY]|uniref:hypothetical protein n=1 Tax=Amphritea sp. HPY TaxID=3421652 RepID=UPI003D7EF757
MKTDFCKGLFFVGLGVTAMFAPAANALEIQAGDWKFSMNGYVNAHAVSVDCDKSGNTVAGNALLCTGENASSVSNGYSPASFNFGASTNKEGYDVSAHIAIEPGTTDNAAFNGNGDGEAYRAYFTIGNAEMGTLKAGRDYGVFGIDVILQDMSLAGVGAPASVKSPLNTTLGGAGYGYIFTDRISQITYSNQTDSGLSGAIGIFQPLDLVSFGGAGFVGDSGSEQPGVHGKVRFDHGAGFVSSTFLTQSVNNGSANYTANAADLTATVNVGATSLAASAFKAEGVGYYGLFIDAADSAGNARDTDGWFVQATHTIGDTKFGINHGVSNVDMAAADTTTLIKSEQKTTAGVYHAWIPGVTVSAEYSAMTAESHAGAEIENNALSVGLSMAF